MATPGNILRLTLRTGPNPVYGDWHPHLELPADLEPVDLGLLTGPILDDTDYITDHSGSSPTPPAGRYRGLADVLDAAVRVLAAGRLFFEEIDNGTRLRFIARTSDTPAVRRALLTRTGP